MSAKVGIIIVSYNASMAVRVTLASLHQAKNATSYRLILVDNASEHFERERIREAFDRHAKGAELSWQYVQQEENLGFSGGNNVGIRVFLEDEEISHICLLNSDVLVTDYWLDRLVEKQCQIVSPVTNKAESEQCVPVDYNLKITDCLDEQAERVHREASVRLATFANRWYEAWQGNLFEADATFFCVLLAKEAMQRVGLLDEAFFPGGYEDDDYCLRARALGYRIFLARDVFIHHWGSASFGQLNYEYFSSHARRNREYLERKHNIVWKSRHEKPFVSYLADVKHAVEMGRNRMLQKSFMRLYAKSLSAMLTHVDAEFRNLRKKVANSKRALPDALSCQINIAQAMGDLANQWNARASEVERLLDGSPLSEGDWKKLRDELNNLIVLIHEKVNANFAIHRFVEMAPSSVPNSRFGKLIWLLRHGIPFLWHLKGIVFFAGYPYPERQCDGYFQRIRIVDRLFTDRWRIYVESDGLPGRGRWFDRPEPNVLVLRILGGPRRRWLVKVLALLAVLRCRKIYYHSVLRMHDNRFGKLMHMPGLTKVIDIHGVVPEEFRFHNDFYSALLFEKQERLAVIKSHFVIVVSEAMRRYLEQKYRAELRGKVIKFPMFPDLAPCLAARPYVEGKPVVVYAGGLHKWQQVPQMLDAIVRTSPLFVYRVYCPDPDAVRDMLPEALNESVRVECKSHEELMGIYPQCHYGFILREDIVVNHVACPTKLVEYLGMGIVPVVDCEDIGDFKSLGMRFIRVQDLLAGHMPSESERQKMAATNFAIYEHLREVRHEGARAIYAALAGGVSPANVGRGTLTELKRAFPSETLRGRLARQVWRTVKALVRRSPQTGIGVRSVEPTAFPESIMSGERCDVLVQVDNFLSGGLENIALDLNEKLILAGFKVVLLVLGTPGAAVERAREKAMSVIISSPERDSYRALLDRLRPELVLTHYSTFGAEDCVQRKIPFIQTIQNTYMWFDDIQLSEFSRASKMTKVFVALSDYAKEYSVARLGVDPDKCVVIPPGVDYSSLRDLRNGDLRRQTRRIHDIADDEFIFLDIGAINHQKNHIATVRAFSSIVRECQKARLIIVGPAYESGLLDEIHRYVAEHGLNEVVTYAGSAPVAHRYYAMADAFVTATFFEGGPLALLEALAANLPVIMPNVGLAISFKGRQGCEIVDPPFNISRYYGRISEMTSTPDFEHRLAAAMVRTYLTRQKPDLDAAMLDALDKRHTYSCYVQLIQDVLRGHDVRGKQYQDTWPNLLRKSGEDPNTLVPESTRRSVILDGNTT